MILKMYFGQTVKKKTKQGICLGSHSIIAKSKKEAKAKLKKHYPKRKIHSVILNRWNSKMVFIT